MFFASKCASFDLESAWKMHKKADRLDGLPQASSRMLYFYAVECGLKFLLLRKRSSPNCPALGRGLFYKHDLGSLCNELGWSRREVAMPRNLKLLLGGVEKKHDGCSDVHLAWRYGVKIDPASENEIMDWLRAMDAIIVKRMKTQ